MAKQNLYPNGYMASLSLQSILSGYYSEVGVCCLKMVIYGLERVLAATPQKK